MIKKLKKIAIFLERRGLSIEAGLLYDLIKSATPLEGIFELPETRVKYEDEEGEELDEPEWSSEEVVKDPTVYGYKPDAWYGALKALGARAILIPFSEENLNESDIMAISEVFGAGSYDYEDLKDSVNSFSTEAHSKFGDRDLLKARFPSLWAEISKLLSDKGIGEEEAVYILFNEDHPPPRGLFTPSKDPQYFSHDIGHIEVDFNENYEMAYSVYHFLFQISRFYKNVDGEDEFILSDQLVDDYEGEHFEQEKIQKLLGDVFGTFSGEPSDEVYDVISNALSGNLNPEIPEKILYDRDTYEFLDENKEEADKLLEDFVESYMKLISDPDPTGYGPLVDWTGQVMFYDI